jgi:hypothetical protein
VLLASGLGIPPITLDLDVICISDVPVAGIAVIAAASARQLLVVRAPILGEQRLSVTFDLFLPKEGHFRRYQVVILSFI